MPRKDPVTGCMVMTTAEFWNKMGEMEGKPAHQVMDEFYSDMEKERQEQENKYKIPEVALATLVEAVGQENKWRRENRERPMAMPAKVLEVISVAYSFGIKNQSTKITVRAVTKGKRVGILEYSEWETAGSFYEPPDGETQISWKF